MTIDTANNMNIFNQFQALQRERKLRIRDAAAAMGVSEGEILAAAPESYARPLARRWADYIPALKDLGEVTAITRNESMVHEKTGPFEDVKVMGRMALTLGDYMDLRIFFEHWHRAFAVEIPRGDDILHSIQIFDQHGDAVFKLYPRGEGAQERWQHFVDRFAPGEEDTPAFEGPAPAPARKRSDKFNLASFHSDWLGMTDTHQFFGLLRKHGVDRVTALENAPENHATKLDVSALDAVLKLASERELDIMVFVGSRGVIQIHSGPVRRIVEMNKWINVLDPDFNLHVDRTDLATAWVVRKPTEDGIVTALEIYDNQDRDVALLFGLRKPGIPEKPEWRELVAEIEHKHRAKR